MQARLCGIYGWEWMYPDGSRGPFILYEVARYAGMISGYTMDGRKCCRPVSEFEALSSDGEDWQTVSTLLSQVPEEDRVQSRPVLDVQLPPGQDQT